MIQRVKFFPGVTSSDDKVLMAPANFAALVYKYKLRKKKMLWDKAETAAAG